MRRSSLSDRIFGDSLLPILMESPHGKLRLAKNFILPIRVKDLIYGVKYSTIGGI